MIRLYGNPRSRAMRCLWMLEETGQPYQLIEKSTRADDLQTAEYIGLNPNARIPTLVDGDVTLWESMAINIYLAQKYDGPLHLAGPKDLGLAAQWSVWAVLEMEELLLGLLEHRAVLPEVAVSRYMGGKVAVQACFVVPMGAGRVARPPFQVGSFAQGEAQCGRRSHLDRHATALTVALGVMRIAN